MDKSKAILLAIGMLIVGLLLGMVTGGVGGYFVGRSARVAISQNFQPSTGQQPNQTQPNQQFPFGPRGNQPNANAVAGARVDQVVADSPAAKAGLQVGDVITAIGGTKIDATHALSDLIQQKKPGDSVDLAVTRGSQTLTITVTLGASAQSSSTAYLGISVTPFTPGGGGRFRMPNG
jgi:membrane-associated protease RseP (regulator of RpoE activity)